MLSELESGECRWIGRHDLQVYCHAPAGKQARYCVVCPDEGLEDYEAWQTLDEAETIVNRILYGNPRATKRGAR